MFVYVKSTYQVLNEDEGSYAFSSPDAHGTAFAAPTHPTIHEVQDLQAPKLSEAEIFAISKIRDICDIHVSLLWMHNARVEY